MLKAIKAGFVVAMVLLLAGCGKDFVRPNTEEFKLGQTTYSQVVQQKGEPKSIEDIVVNEKNVKAVRYIHVEMNDDGILKIPEKSLTYFFYNDALVGQQFSSSFKSDSSDFDDSKVASIFKGKTTRREVIQLLGKPTGAFIYPMTKTKEISGEAIGYDYRVVRRIWYFALAGGFKVFIKSLRVSFDENDVVSELDYKAVGDRP